jgi:muramoyltetrapeptide carboxypeptidase LdcA involved in peptidoglycan recycling
MAAFSDPKNKAVFASIGGEDQIQLIKYLDPAVFKENPKPFFGYSDNTHLHNFLWNLGIPSFYGGGIMTQFAMQGRMDDYTINSLKHALFENSSVEISPSTEFNEIGLRWKDKDNLSIIREYAQNQGHMWDGKGVHEGVLWGGCVESFIAQMATAKYLPQDTDLDGVVLYLETAEDIPDQWIIEYLLVGMGERGWLDRFSAILVGRPKAWEFNKQLNQEERDNYRKEQRLAVQRTVRKYNQRIPIVQNIDFGHTDPQCIVPSGSIANVNADNQTIIFEY